MRILFGSNYRVGQTGEFALLALERMGIDLIPFTPTAGAPENWRHTAPDVDAVELYESLPEKPDLFLMVESSTGQPFLPQRIDELPIPTAYWLYDNYLNFRWNKEVAALFDYVFFAQVKRVWQANAYGRKNVYWLPFAADEEFHKNFHVERDIDIGYLGTITDQKRRYFSDLEKAGYQVVTNDRYLSYEEIGRFYSRCKLVYNILARRDMNVRTFEAPAAGALVVNQRWIDEGVHQIFTEGKDMVFHSFSDAPAICRELLADDERRERMAAAGEKVVMEQHTYRHRMERLLDICKEGVTQQRRERAMSHVAPAAEALTLMHRDFNWLDRGQKKMAEAFRRSFVGTLAYLIHYGWWRVKEKLEKLWWSLGKAPV